MVSMRIADAPSRGARVAYAVLAFVLAGLGGMILLIVVSPLMSAAEVCRVDPFGLCGFVARTLVWLGATCLALGWSSYALRLGAGFWALMVAALLVSFQVGIEVVALWPILLFVGLLVGAALVSDPERRGRGSLQHWFPVALATIVFLEFGLWCYEIIWG